MILLTNCARMCKHRRHRKIFLCPLNNVQNEINNNHFKVKYIKIVELIKIFFKIRTETSCLPVSGIESIEVLRRSTGCPSGRVRASGCQLTCRAFYCERLLQLCRFDRPECQVQVAFCWPSEFRAPRRRRERTDIRY